MARDAVAVSVIESMPARCAHRYDIGSDWLKTIRTPGPNEVPNSGSVAFNGMPASASAAKELTA